MMIPSVSHPVRNFHFIALTVLVWSGLVWFGWCLFASLVGRMVGWLVWLGLAGLGCLSLYNMTQTVAYENVLQYPFNVITSVSLSPALSMSTSEDNRTE